MDGNELTSKLGVLQMLGNKADAVPCERLRFSNVSINDHLENVERMVTDDNGVEMRGLVRDFI